jgi:uncharacterized protein YbjT (DUF2867 family)
MKKILVVGSSGTVGSELVKLLRSQGHQVKEVTSKDAQGDKVHMNLVTGEGIKEGFEGIERAFFLSPPGYADQYALLSPLIQEAKRRGLKKVVLMTAMGANAVETSPFRRAEIELEKSGLNYNIIRPNWFLQNFNTFWVQGIKQAQKIQLPAGNAKTSFIDARDISLVAAVLLTSDKFNNKDFDITGPEAVTHAEVAQAISEVTAKKVTYEDVESDVLRQGLLGAGLPKDYTEFLIMIMGFLREGYNAGINKNVELITGKAPLSLKEYARDFKQSWV